MGDDLDFLKYIFADECGNNIAKISEMEKEALNKNSFDLNEINIILRILHSIKGSASMMGFMGIAQVSHSLEELYIYMKDSDFSEKEFNYIINLSELALNYILKEISNIETETITFDYGYGITKFITDFLNEKSLEYENQKFLEKLKNSSGKTIKPYKIKKKDFYILEEKSKRLISILSMQLSKSVELIIKGADVITTESINEKVSIAVLQLIKNSVDNGIETKEERLKKGKNEKGIVIIDISKNDDILSVVVSDDGVGLDKQEIFNKALKKGIVNKNINEYTDEEIYSFIMYPGFTTKNTVSMFSGRGIGLDAANGAICSVGGCIIISSKKSEGTSFIIKIPLK